MREIMAGVSKLGVWEITGNLWGWGMGIKTLISDYGSFIGDWRLVKLKDICVSPKGVQTGPFGSQLHQRDYQTFGTPIITVEHLVENRIIHQDLPCVSDIDYKRLERYILQTGDIVFSRVGSVDRRAIVRESENGWLFSSRCLRVRPNSQYVDSFYLSYFFGLSSFKEHIRRIAVGATMPSLNTDILSNLEIILPPLSEQKAIAHILGTLDDKIELNKQMNETLEAIARAIFKSWFVNFDPVRAKMEGKQPPGMDAATADLFPDEFEESSLGLIPKGWRVGTIETECKLIMGQSPKSEFYNTTGDGLPFHQGVTNFGIRFPTHKIFCSVSQRIANLGDILLSVRAPVGRINIANENLIIGRGLAAIRHNQDFQSFLLYNLNHTFKEEDSIGTGTIFASVTRKELQEIKLIAPRNLIVKLFDAQIKSIDNIIAQNEQQSHTLATIRDTLLPKLISGKIRVKEAEKILEGVS